MIGNEVTLLKLENVVSDPVYLITKYLNTKNIHRIAKGKKIYIEDLR